MDNTNKLPVVGLVMCGLVMGMIAFAAVGFFTSSLLFGFLAAPLGASFGCLISALVNSAESHD